MSSQAAAVAVKEKVVKKKKAPVDVEKSIMDAVAALDQIVQERLDKEKGVAGSRFPDIAPVAPPLPVKRIRVDLKALAGDHGNEPVFVVEVMDKKGKEVETVLKLDDVIIVGDTQFKAEVGKRFTGCGYGSDTPGKAWIETSGAVVGKDRFGMKVTV